MSRAVCPRWTVLRRKYRSVCLSDLSFCLCSVSLLCPERSLSLLEEVEEQDACTGREGGRREAGRAEREVALALLAVSVHMTVCVLAGGYQCAKPCRQFPKKFYPH